MHAAWCSSADCAICSEGYFSSTRYTCTECPENSARAVGAVLTVALIVGAALVFFLFKALRGNRGGDRATPASWRKILLSLKIVVVAWQILTQVGSVI